MEDKGKPKNAKQSVQIFRLHEIHLTIKISIPYLSPENKLREDLVDRPFRTGLPDAKGAHAPSRSPEIYHGAMIAPLGGEKIEVEGGQVFQRGVKNLFHPCINGLDVLVAFFAEVNPIQFFSLGLKELERTRLFVFTEGASDSFRSSRGRP